jgi:hypothetical protein
MEQRRRLPAAADDAEKAVDADDGGSALDLRRDDRASDVRASFGGSTAQQPGR